MTLQILVSHYKENLEVVSRFLKSLETQNGVQFEVLICSDGADKLDDSFLSQFNLNLTYRYLPHGGMCRTRNALLDMSTADYIMFCDIDDCFISSDGLATLMKTAERTSADVIGSPYLAERIKDGKYERRVFEHDIIRLHGKIFKREYLKDKDIRFPDEIEKTGDMMFLWLAYHLTKRIVWISEMFYFWRYNPNSLTRNDPLALAYMYRETIYTYVLTARVAKKYNLGIKYDELIGNIIYMMYWDINGKRWQGVDKKLRSELEQVVYDFLEEFYEDFKSIKFIYKRLFFYSMKEYNSIQDDKIKTSDVDKWVESVLNI